MSLRRSPGFSFSGGLVAGSRVYTCGGILGPGGTQPCRRSVGTGPLGPSSRGVWPSAKEPWWRLVGGCHPKEASGTVCLPTSPALTLSLVGCHSDTHFPRVLDSLATRDPSIPPRSPAVPLLSIRGVVAPGWMQKRAMGDVSRCCGPLAGAGCTPRGLEHSWCLTHAL